MEYKVVTMKDRFFSCKFDPETLESMLNSYAAEGWKLKEAVAPTQNSTLAEVKKILALKAIQMGGNGIMDFKYGQKADKPLKNIFSFKWDTERMKASGKVVKFEFDPRNIDS